MDNKASVGAKLVNQPSAINKPAQSNTRPNKVEKRHEPYLLPCGNSDEFCFNQVMRKNARFCRVWRKSIWGHCRHAVFTPQHQWKEYGE